MLAIWKEVREGEKQLFMSLTSKDDYGQEGLSFGQRTVDSPPVPPPQL